LLLGALLLGQGGAAQATLVNYQVGGVDLVWESDRNLTWVADANLFQTQYGADPGTVERIIAAVPTVPTSWDGPHQVVAGDFDTGSGLMNWWGAMAWAQWLGSIRYGGASDWRLPATAQPDAACSDHYAPIDGFPLQGYGDDCTGSDLGQLFYTAGELTAGESILADPPGILGGYFVNMQSFPYWSGTEVAWNPGLAWFFSTNSGYQNYSGESSQSYGWAVRPGRVAAAPLPATGLLMALGLAALGVSRRGRRSTLAIR
jgi:hypothetical protein